MNKREKELRKQQKYWLTNSEENKVYDRATCYRAVGIEDFTEKVEEEYEIVGIDIDGNNICFILEDKP